MNCQTKAAQLYINVLCSSKRPSPLFFFGFLDAGSCWKHDVFLNFRGEDTRKIFVSHLNKALEQKTINTFIDSEELRKGDDISEILNAIQNSRLSVVVLSENYASSTWCLKELVTILDCMDTKNQIVVPIFYQVNPSHVRKLKRSFSDAFIKHQDDPNSDKEEVKSWQLALTRTSNLSGWDSRDYRDDAKLIEEIVEDIFNKLIHISSSKATGLVGIDSHIDEMALLLFPDQVENVRIVGIWGMGGLGKTTIARAVYDQIACQFEYCCFLENVKEGFRKYGAIRMQEELLSRILKEKRPSIGSLNRGLNMIMRRLSRKKVVLVLDDVDDLAQIETLLGKQHSFGGGSRIIITTRDAQLLGGVDAIYRPKFFGYDEALKLFMQYAFRTNQYTEDYYDLSNHAVEYAQGLPLALKVLGACLDNKSVREWKDVLEKIKKSPHKGVQDVLKTSFDGLDHSEKDIFLDIACFFKGINKDYATKILDSCGFFPISGLRVLVDRSLVTISNHNKLDMHDLLQETGWEIVRQESIKDPGRRSRLWSYKDIDDMLTQNTATEAVESICLDLPNSKEVYLNAEAFVRMTKLRLLKVRYNRNIDSDEEALSCEDLCHPDDCKQELTGDLKFLSHELRCLLWYGCPLKSFPSNFQPKNLFHLDMPYSNIHKLWEGTKSLKNLEFINLSHSRYLEKIPDLSEAKNLEKLILEGCVSLYEVHPSISALENLVSLSLKGCKELKILPSSIGMKSLETLILSGCSNLEKFPQISEVMKEISELYLDETAIKELPSSIENLKGLVTLNLKDCRDLLSLPSSICQLKSLRYVTLSGCSKFEVLPESICTLRNLKVLALSGCLKLHHLPENLGNLESLVKLEVRGSGIQQIPFSILRLKKLKSLSGHRCKEMKAPFSSWSSSIRENCSYSSLLHLDLSDCNMLELSDGIYHLSSLKMLELQRNNMESLPAAMNRLHHLTVLKLEACKRLKSIPELSSSINFIDAHNCTSLETVLTPKPPYTNLCFTFSNCLQLVQNNPFRDVVETHYHYQGNYMRSLSFLMSLPGSEIPDWFNHQCIGSSVTVQLPKNLFDNKFLGFSICGITDVKGGHHASKLSAQCFCTFRGNHSKYSFSFYLVDWGFTTDRFLKSDHMFLGHVPWSEYHQGEPVNQRYYTEAEFKIVVKNEVNVHDFTAAAVAAVQQPCIKRSGVHFVCSSHDLWREPANPKRSFKGYSYNEGEGEPSEITYDVEKYLKRLEHIGGTKENSGEYASDDAQGELLSSEIIDDAELSSSEIVDGPEQC